MHTFEYALKRVGENGKYQFKVLMILSINIFTIASQSVFPTYTYIKPNLICEGQVCIENKETCSSNYIIDPEFKYVNLVTQFHLFCDRDFYIYVASSINFLGSILAGACITYLADNYGRKSAYLGTLILQVFTYIGIYFCNTIYQLITCNLVMGFAIVGNYILMPVIINEICGTAYRQIYTLFLLAIWSIAVILLSLGFKYIIDWRTIQLYYIIIPSIIALILSIFILLETPKYYYSKNDKQSTLTILDQMAQINSKPNLQDNSLDLKDTINEKSSYSLIDLFRYPSLSLPSLGFILISYGLHLLYYGSQYGLRSFSEKGLVYVLGFIVGVVELLSNITLMFLIQDLSRKSTVLFSFVLSITCCFLCLIFGFRSIQIACELCLEKILLFILIAFIRIAVTMGFGLQGLWSNEFYPTPVRAIGSGFLFSVGLLGSFSAPYVQALSHYFRFNIYVLIGLITLPTAFGTIFAEETQGQLLKDRIQEEEYEQLHPDPLDNDNRDNN